MGARKTHTSVAGSMLARRAMITGSVGGRDMGMGSLMSERARERTATRIPT